MASDKSSSITVLGGEHASAFRAHVKKWKACERCTIAEYAHRRAFFRGRIPCRVLFVGEAPGKTEDAIGYPFVGRGGQLLDIWLSNFPIRYGVVNLTLCRSCDGPGERDRRPTDVEVSNCRDRLIDIVRLSGADTLVAVGKAAAVGLRAPAFLRHTVFQIPCPSWVLRDAGSIQSDDMYRRAVDEIKRIGELLQKKGTTR